MGRGMSTHFTHRGEARLVRLVGWSSWGSKQACSRCGGISSPLISPIIKIIKM